MRSQKHLNQVWTGLSFECEEVELIGLSDAWINDYAAVIYVNSTETCDEA